MAQRYINTRIWEDNYVFSLNPSEKLVFMYLLTNDAANIAGVYEINLRMASMETGIEQESLLRVIDKFTADCKVYYVEGHIIVRNFIKYQTPSPKILQGINNIVQALPERVRKLILINDQGLWLDARELAGKNGGKLTLLTDRIDTMWLSINKKDNSRGGANNTPANRGRRA